MNSQTECEKQILTNGNSLISKYKTLKLDGYDICLTWNDCTNKIITKTNSSFSQISKNNNTKNSNTKNDGYLRRLNSRINWWKDKVEYNQTSLEQTLKFIWENFGSGIFVEVKDNKIEKYIVLYNMNYTNDFDFGTFDKNRLISYLKQHKIKFNYHKILDKHKWRLNNCLFKWMEDEPNENYILEFHYLLSHLLKIRNNSKKNNKNNKNAIFFINKRDFPIIMKDLSFPYTISAKLKYIPDKWIPIYSTGISKNSVEIPLPTVDDIKIWSKKYFPPRCNNYYTTKPLDITFDKKENVLFFRGSSTGCGITPETNQRLYYVKLSQDSPILAGQTKLDIGITRQVKKDKWLPNSKTIGRIDLEKYGIKIADSSNMEDQSKYKFIMDIEGNAIAFRLGYLLSLNSVIIRIKSDYEFWLDYLISDQQVITIIPYDKENLEKSIKYCNENPKFAQQLAENCVKLYDKIYNKNGILEYLDQVIFNIF